MILPPRISPTRLGLFGVAAAVLLGASGCVGVVNGPSILQIAKLALACIPEGTAVDTPGGSRAIEDIRPGELVVGFGGEPVRVLQKHSYVEDPDRTRFRRIEFRDGSVVELCDMHRIAGIRARDLRPGMSVAGFTVVSNRAFGSVHRSYDLLTEDAGYRIQGVPVNSMIDELARTAVQGTAVGRRTSRNAPFRHPASR